MLEDLSLSHFEPHVGASFSVSAEGVGSFDLELTGAGPVGTDPLIEQFALDFRGRPDVIAPQGIYRFSHPSMGEFWMFIVLNRQDGEGTYYQAAFSRLRQEKPTGK